MLFGVRLAKEIYQPWLESYIDYEGLKRLLKEDITKQYRSAGMSTATSSSEYYSEIWTEKEESAFVEKLDAELEKVYAFESQKYSDLKDKVSAAEASMNALVPQNTSDGPVLMESNDLEQFESQLDSILSEAKELERFTRINYTGFFKIVKKHDRLYSLYSVKPLLQVRLNALPFNSENYSPILYKYVCCFIAYLYVFMLTLIDCLLFMHSLEAMLRYRLPRAFHRVRLEACRQPPNSLRSIVSIMLDSLVIVRSQLTCIVWVHPDNLMEVKTFILRHLPLLVYNPQTSKLANASAPDPTITTLYLDNPDFQLYLEKLESRETASSLRLRWYGKLNLHPEIFIERKFVDPEHPETTQEQRIPIKAKYVKPFIQGTYSMEKTVKKMTERNAPPIEIQRFKTNVSGIQDFIKSANLQPMMRTVYSRTAFQIPDDERVRISIDNDIDLIREDSLDLARPCRDPDDWHRRDIDDMGLEHPFKMIRKGEITRFPYAVMDIKLAVRPGEKIKPSWVKDIMSSHLVKEAPRFSKFAHGVATLFDDEEYINVLPYWLSELRRYP